MAQESENLCVHDFLSSRFVEVCCAMSFSTVSVSVLASPHVYCMFVYLCVLGVLQRAHRNIFPLLRGAAVLLSPTRSRAAHCICVLCVTSCVRLWIVCETMVCFALKGHLNHLPLGCKRRRIQSALLLRDNMPFSPLCCHLNAA